MRNQLVESTQERLELIFYTSLYPPLYKELNVFCFVLVRNCDISSSRFEIDSDGFSESVVFSRESIFNDILDIVFTRTAKVQVSVVSRLVERFIPDSQNPSERSENFSIHGFHICENDLLLENHFVECCDEVGIEETTVEDC